MDTEICDRKLPDLDKDNAALVPIISVGLPAIRLTTENPPIIGSVCSNSAVIFSTWLVGGIYLAFAAPVLPLLPILGAVIVAIADLKATAREASGDRVGAAQISRLGEFLGFHRNSSYAVVDIEAVEAVEAVVRNTDADAERRLSEQAKAVLEAPLLHTQYTTLEPLTGLQSGLQSGASPEPVRSQSGGSPEPVRSQSGASPEPVRSQSGGSPEPVRSQSGGSPEPVRWQSGASPVAVRSQSGASPAAVRRQFAYSPETVRRQSGDASTQNDSMQAQGDTNLSRSESDSQDFLSGFSGCEAIDIIPDDDDSIINTVMGRLTNVGIADFKKLCPDGGFLDVEQLSVPMYKQKATDLILKFIQDYRPTSIEVVTWWGFGAYRKTGTSPAAAKWQKASNFVKEVQKKEVAG
jgi:hypothetical protein